MDAPDPPEGGATVGRSRRRLRLGLLTSGSALAVLFVLGYVVVPYPWTLRSRNPERTSLMAQRIREARGAGETLQVQMQWVPLEEISPRLTRAVLVAEDFRFREHRGIDWISLAEEVQWSGDDTFSWRSASDRRALASALRYVWANRNEIRGRSTITQQLAKNLYFGTDRSFFRKVMEFVVARRLERRLDKDRILELYLNVVEWGPGVFGAEAASHHYFGQSASSLSLDQAAALAATLPHPLTSNPARSPRRMLWRKNLILQRLDPAAGVPSEPMPLPDIEIELPEAELDSLPVLELPPPQAPPPDSAVVPPDTAGATSDSSTPGPDTAATPPDTSRALARTRTR